MELSTLKELGLSYYESKIVEVLMNGKCSLRELSEKANIPFGKIYSIIKSMNGMVKETNSRPKLVYIENTSTLIDKLIEARKTRLTMAFDKLREAVTIADKGNGQQTKFFQIGTTIEDNKNIQLRTFIEAKKEVLQILNIHHKPKSNRASKTLWEIEIEKAVARGVVFKSIYPVKAELPQILNKLNEKHPDKFQVHKFDTDFVRCDIIDGKKVLVKLVHEDPLQFGGVLFIENESLAENLTKIFYEFWHKSQLL